MLARSLAVAGLVIALSAAPARADEVAPPPPIASTSGGPPIVIVLQPPPATAAKRAKKPKPKRERDIPLAVAGGTIVGVGAVTALAGFIGYFASIDCSSSSGFIFPTVSCRDEPMWWAAVGGGFALAGLAGTPMLVAGLRGRELPANGAPATSAELLVGPTSAGLRVRF